MIEQILTFMIFSAITLFTVYWALTFVAQVKHDEYPHMNIKVYNPVEIFEKKKKVIKDHEDLLKNG